MYYTIITKEVTKMKMINEELGKMKILEFEAEDVNDPDWEKIIKILHENGIRVMWGNDNFMNFAWKEEWED